MGELQTRRTILTNYIAKLEWGVSKANLSGEVEEQALEWGDGEGRARVRIWEQPRGASRVEAAG